MVDAVVVTCRSGETTTRAAERVQEVLVLLGAPPGGVVLLTLLLAFGLGRDPSVVRSALIGRRAPVFDLPLLDGTGRLGLAETLLVRSRYRQRLLHSEDVTAVVPAKQLLITARRPAAPRARPVTAATARVGKSAAHTLVQLVAFLAPRVRAGSITAGRLSLVLIGNVRREVLPRAARAASRTAVSVCAMAAALLDEVERLTALDGQPQPEQPANDRGEVPERVLQ